MEPLKPLIIKLQIRNSDIYEAYQMIDRVITDICWPWVWSLVWIGPKNGCSGGGQESKPRTTNSFSTYTDNIPSNDIKEYWRRTTAEPVMDKIIAQLEDRLGDCQHTNLFIVLPSVMLNCDIGVFEKKLQEIGIFDSNFCIKLKL